MEQVLPVGLCMKPSRRSKNKKTRQKLKKIVRFAIWEQRNGFCVRCGEPIEYRDVEIDHIIAIALANKPDEFRQLLIRHELRLDFNVHALYNLHPMHRRCNLSKAAKLISPAVLLDWLSLAEKNEKRIQKRIDKYEKEPLMLDIIVIAKQALTQKNFSKAEADGYQTVIRHIVVNHF